MAQLPLSYVHSRPRVCVFKAFNSLFHLPGDRPRRGGVGAFGRGLLGVLSTPRMDVQLRKRLMLLFLDLPHFR